MGVLVDLSAEACVPKPLNILTVSKEWNAGYILSKKDNGASPLEFNHARRYTAPRGH